jgi:hypothetical protein
MSHRFTRTRPTVGATLPHDRFGRLVGQFQSSSHIPLRGGQDTGRHIYLSLKVPEGPSVGIFECAVNIRSDEGTTVLYCERIEDLDSGGAPADGFNASIRLSYGAGLGGDGVDYIGLTDSDFKSIVNDELYNRIADLSQGCDRMAAYGVTYSDGTGIHDIHMNSGTDPATPTRGATANTRTARSPSTSTSRRAARPRALPPGSSSSSPARAW